MLVVTINKARKNPKPTGFVGYPVCPGLSYQIDLDALPGVGPRIGECWSYSRRTCYCYRIGRKKALTGGIYRRGSHKDRGPVGIF